VSAKRRKKIALPVGRGPGRPRRDTAAARAVARAERTGETLSEAAAAEGVSKTVAYNERARLEALAQQGPAQPGAPDLADVGGRPALSARQLAQVKDLLGRMPDAQREKLLLAFPLPAPIVEAHKRGLAGHPEAARQLADELSKVR
jgi:hypothetical protein